MRAAIVEDYGKVVIKDIPKPTPGYEEALIKISAAGVCHSPGGPALHRRTGHGGDHLPAESHAPAAPGRRCRSHSQRWQLKQACPMGWSGDRGFGPSARAGCEVIAPNANAANNIPIGHFMANLIVRPVSATCRHGQSATSCTLHNGIRGREDTRRRKSATAAKSGTRN